MKDKKTLICGVELTDEQIERGDLELYDIEIIEEDMGEIGEEFLDDADVSMWKLNLQMKKLKSLKEKWREMLRT